MRRLTLAATLALIAGTVSASPVIYDFSGTITSGTFGGAYGLPLPYVTDSVGRVASGSVTVDLATPDQNPDPSFGTYALLDFEVQFNGMSFVYDAASSPADSLAYIQVNNFDGPQPVGNPNNSVGVVAQSATSDALVGLGTGNERAWLQLGYFTEDVGIINSDTLPALDAFPDLGFLITIYDPTAFVSSNSLSAVMHLTRRPDAVSVPEPAPLPLLAVGLIAVIAGRWTMKRAARSAAGA